MNTADVYTRAIRALSGRHAAWPPESKIALGDVGEFQPGVGFSKFGTIEDIFGISLEAEPVGEPVTNTYSSGSGVHVDLGAQASGPINAAVANAGGNAKVTFDRQDGVFLQLDAARIHRTKNIRQVQRLVDQEFKLGNWELPWAVVVEVTHAASATALVSAEAGASIELQAAAAATVLATDLAKAELGWSITRDKHMASRMIAQSGVTPLFRVVRLKRRWRTGFSARASLEAVGSSPADEPGFASVLTGQQSWSTSDRSEVVAWLNQHLTRAHAVALLDHMPTAGLPDFAAGASAFTDAVVSQVQVDDAEGHLLEWMGTLSVKDGGTLQGIRERVGA